MEIKPEWIAAAMDAAGNRPLTVEDLSEWGQAKAHIRAVAPLIAADALAASPWRKVPETVTPGVEPFDGNGYLVFFSWGVYPCVTVALYDGGREWVTEAGMADVSPTHYMPIPPAPELDE